jgi:hypothetical protein
VWLAEGGGGVGGRRPGALLALVFGVGAAGGRGRGVVRRQEAAPCFFYFLVPRSCARELRNGDGEPPLPPSPSELGPFETTSKHLDLELGPRRPVAWTPLRL